MRAVYGIGFKDMVLIATVDQKLIVKCPNLTKVFPTLKPPQNGTWEAARGGSYALELTEGTTTAKAEGVVEDRKLTFNLYGTALVFEK